MPQRMYKPSIIVLTALLVLAGLGAGRTAAAPSPHRYSPKHGHCKRGYRRVKRHKKVLCIKKRGKAATAEKIKLHAHLDPTYTRDPADPFKVTYAYSASATQEPVAASVSSETPAPLPSGVLALYSDGKLECAVNVGGGFDESACPVTYSALGSHTITTIYSSGEQSATETEVEHIEAIPTSTSVGISFALLPYSSWEAWKVRVSGSGPPGSGEEGWRIGTLTVTLGAQPAGAFQTTLTCPEAKPGCLNLSQPAGGILQLGVYVMSNEGPGAPIDNWIHFGTPQEGEGFAGWQWVPDIEGGKYFLRGVSQCFFHCGYATSEATSLVQFSPGSFPTEPTYGELPRP